MSRKRNKKTYCLNCQYSFSQEENYCPNCGQENHDLKIPIRHFVEEFLEGIFHFDNKLWHSLKTMFFYPGKITKDFLEGKRVSFVPPIRMYIFVSFIFFLFLNYTYNKKTKIKSDESLVEAIAKMDSKDSSINLGLDSLNSALSTVGDTSMSSEEKKILSKLKNTKGKDIASMNEKIYKYLSFAMFLMLPIFAFIMKLVFYRSDKFYYEHFIASIHYHVVMFVIMILGLIIYWFNLSAVLYVILFIAAFVYFAIGLKKVFEQSWLKIILKAFVVYMIYGFLLLILVSAVSIYTGLTYFQS